MRDLTDEQKAALIAALEPKNIAEIGGYEAEGGICLLGGPESENLLRLDLAMHHGLSSLPMGLLVLTPAGRLLAMSLKREAELVEELRYAHAALECPDSR